MTKKKINAEFGRRVSVGRLSRLLLLLVRLVRFGRLAWLRRSWIGTAPHRCSVV